MKPVYQGCMEKGIQHVATQAAEVAVGGSRPNRSAASPPRSQHQNGKVKRSWEYATVVKRSSSPESRDPLSQFTRKNSLQYENEGSSSGSVWSKLLNKLFSNSNRGSKQHIVERSKTKCNDSSDSQDRNINNNNINNNNGMRTTTAAAAAWERVPNGTAATTNVNSNSGGGQAGATTSGLSAKRGRKSKKGSMARK